LKTYIEIADLLQLPAEAAWARAELAKFDALLQQHTWDGEWFVRAYREDGALFGSAKCNEGKIFLNPQSWAVLSGAATPAQARQAMDAVEKHLATEFGLAICAPAFEKIDHHVMRAVLMNPGNKENGGIFSHTQGWAVMADTMLGNGDRAYRHYRAYMPAAQNDKTDVREVEPYVHCQSTHSHFSKKFGRSRVPWLSGTASWSYFAATQYILGIRPEQAGLRLDPCIPAAWPGFTVTRQFRDKKLKITVENPNGIQKGVAKLVLNGQELPGNLIPVEALKPVNKIQVVMG